ncbi:MAG: flagellar hook-associated protein FlgK [Burkholderiaceae bacterium]
MSGLIGIGLSGLRAAQAGLVTTGHNIANVNTQGFTRQETVLSAATAQFTGAGYVGQGVNVTTVRRIYSDYLTQSVRDGVATSSRADAYATEIKRVDSWLADSSSNLSSAIDSFFSSAHTVANSPSDSAARQTLLSSARTLAARFNDLGQRLDQQGSDIDRQISDTITSVNTLAQQVAGLNQRILTDGRDPAISQVPNDLLDQRDALVRQIAGAIGATALPQSDGSVNLFVSNGQPLVVGRQANALIAVPDDQDPSKQQLAVQVSGTAQRISTAQVEDGTLGGLFRFRDDVLSQTRNSLGQIAIAIGSALNAQNKLGQDASGAPGIALFSVGSPAVIPAKTNSAGSGLAVSIADPSRVTASDYRLDFDGTSYKLTNLADKSTRIFASLPQTVDGVKIATSRPLAAGDRFIIAPTRNGAHDFAVATTDPARIAAAGPVMLTIGSGNAGSARQASLAVLPADPLPSTLRAPVDVRFRVASGTTTYDLVDRTSGSVLSAGNPYTDGAAIAQNGWSLTLAGTPADNDLFTVGPNVGGSGDNRNALLLAQIQQNVVTLSGSAQDAYNGLVGIIGNKTNEADALSNAEQSLLTQAQDSRDAVSGVNLDEEAANLQRYQQAYQAASKSIATASAMFDAVLALFR